MKTKQILLVVLLSISHFSLCQNFSPLKTGTFKSFQMANATYTVEVLKDKVTQNGFEYFQHKTTYSWGSETIVLLRIDEDGNELYLDPKSKTESINFPANPQLGFSWMSTDGAWKYEVFKMDATFITPKDKYKNCLIIKAEQLTGRDKEKLSLYFNYYVNNIGYVGSENNKGLMSWLTKYKIK